MRVSFRVLALVSGFALLSGHALAQVDLGLLQRLYQDLQSNNVRTRFKALLVIRSTDEYLKAPETADRLLAFMDLEKRERQEIRRLSLSGGRYEYWSDDYADLLGVAWDLWKDKLTPEAFRVFAEASYNSNSRYAKELGARAGPFAKELLILSADGNEFVRGNAAALIVYALAEDDKKTLPITPLERVALMVQLTKSAQDADYGVRVSIVGAMKSAGGPWAIPLLDQMREREAGEGASYLREQASLAVEAIRSLAAQPTPAQK